MKSIFDHIDHVKSKPHHIRKRVAFATALFSTAFIALVWLVGSVTAGAFAIHATSFADSTGAASATTGSADTTADQNLAGAGAAAALQDSSNAPAHIEIIDSSTTAAPVKQEAEQTTIPF